MISNAARLAIVSGEAIAVPRVTDVYAAIIPTLDFQPMLHVNYENTVLHLKDGLPKQKDMPAEMGGSGTLLPD